MFDFASKVEHLREASEAEVAGIFFTISRNQEGALKHAEYCGVKVAIFGAGQEPARRFGITFERYDRERDRRIKDAIIKLEPARVTATATLSYVVIRADGTVEER